MKYTRFIKLTSIDQDNKPYWVNPVYIVHIRWVGELTVTFSYKSIPAHTEITTTQNVVKVKQTPEDIIHIINVSQTEQ